MGDTRKLGPGRSGPSGGVHGTLAIVALLINAVALMFMAVRFRSLQEAVHWDLVPRAALRASSAAAQPFSEASAPKLLVEVFIDVSCDQCRHAAMVVLAARDSLTRSQGEVFRWQYRAVSPAPTSNNLGFRSGLVAVCSIWQGKEWDLWKAAAQHPSWDEEGLRHATAAARLDGDSLNRCIRSPKAESDLWESRFYAASKGVAGTPTLLVNGGRLEGLRDEAQVLGFLRDILARAGEGGTASADSEEPT